MSAALILLLSFSGNIYDDAVAEGNQAYTEQRLEAAIAAYERVVASGIQNAPVYYNLATAYYQAGDLGHAVLNYDRALGVDSGFAPAKRGLEAVANGVGRPLDFPPGYQAPIHRYRAWTIGAWLVFWWLLWGILLLRRWKPRRHGRVIVIGALLCFVFLVSISLTVSRLPRAAVLIVDQSSLQYGPDLRDESRLLLEAGERLKLRRVLGEWAQVETSEMVRGWVLRENVREVWPAGPY